MPPDHSQPLLLPNANDPAPKFGANATINAQKLRDGPNISIVAVNREAIALSLGLPRTASRRAIVAEAYRQNREPDPEPMTDWERALDRHAQINDFNRKV